LRKEKINEKENDTWELKFANIDTLRKL